MFFYCTRKRHVGTICRTFTENNASKSLKWHISIQTIYSKEFQVRRTNRSSMKDRYAMQWEILEEKA